MAMATHLPPLIIALYSINASGVCLARSNARNRLAREARREGFTPYVQRMDVKPNGSNRFIVTIYGERN